MEVKNRWQEVCVTQGWVRGLYEQVCLTSTQLRRQTPAGWAQDGDGGGAGCPVHGSEEAWSL